MTVAELVGSLGTCSRASVGALLVKSGRCISWGYNGAPPGQPHCAHTRDEPCTNATHAEANALAFAARQGISTEGATLYVTLSPCAVCARLLIAAGVSKVVSKHEYHDVTGLMILREAGVLVR
jgi:dCMP deaminase